MTVRGRSLEQDELHASQQGTMAPSDLCLIMLPKSVFVSLSDEAAKRNMTFAQFLAAAVDSYLDPEVQSRSAPQAEQVVQQEQSSFEFTPPRVAPSASQSRPRLRRFE